MRMFRTLLASSFWVVASASQAQLTTPPVVPTSQSGVAGAPSSDLMVPVLRSPAQTVGSPGTGIPPAGLPDGAEALRQTRTPLRDAREEIAPNEFQKFVFAATGQSLPIFGANFFSDVSTLPLAMERLPAPADYLIGPGDEIHVRAWGSVDLDVKAVVDRNGQISLPRIGTVSVARQRLEEVEQTLRMSVARTFKGFNLSVTLGQLRGVQIFVVGQARKPGTYSMAPLATLMGAVFVSGGPGPNGSMRRVQLRRGGSVVAELDLYEFIVHGDRSKDVRLQHGDAVVFLPSGPRVAVLGATDAAAVFELKAAGEPLKDILALGGGTRATTNATRAQLERIDAALPRAPRSVQSLDLRAASQLRLADGDVVTLFDIEPEFANAVTLRGNVARPLRYPYKPGMRISDLIPERAALITPDYHLRKNRLVQFLELDPLSGLPTNATPEQRAAALLRGGATTRLQTERINTERSVNDVRNLVDEPNWEYATVERLNPDRITLTLTPFNLAKAVVERDPTQDLLLQPGDVVTIFSSRDIRGPQSRGTRLARVEGEVDRPGVYQLLPGETLRGLIARAGGPTGQAYLFGLEFSRSSTRDKQRQALQDAIRRLETTLSASGTKQLANLSTTDPAAAARLQAAEEESRKAQLVRLRNLQPTGRIALELQATITDLKDIPDLPLEDGDSISVPSRPGFVFAVGAVSNDNAILWRPGRTVSSYLVVAGVNPDADEANMFILRADGTVVHRRDRGGWMGNSFGALELAPGDTIVVPDLANRETVWSAFVRGAKDWTQILSNFGLAAAAIKTLRQ